MNLLEKLASEETLRSAWRSLEKRPHSYGFDGVTINDFKQNLDENIRNISGALLNGSYKYHPLRLYLADKKDGGYRPIKIPTVKDRVVQRAITDLISPPLDATHKITNSVSYAYIKQRDIEMVAGKLLEFSGAGYRYVCKADIIKFFDKIDKQKLLDQIKAALPDNTLDGLIEEALKNDIANADYYERKTGSSYVPNSVIGIAQGSPLSPLFANVYLASFDAMIEEKGYKMLRYADDFVLLTKTKDEARQAYDVARTHLRSLKLDLYPLKDDIPAELWEKGAKYSIVSSTHNLEFLGLRFASNKVYPAGMAFKNVLKNVRQVANDPALSFAKKLVAITSRMQGWCSTYKFATLEDQKVKALDDSFEEILNKMIEKHGLKKVTRKPLKNVLGVPNFEEIIRANQQKKLKVQQRQQAAIEWAKKDGYPVPAVHSSSKG